MKVTAEILKPVFIAWFSKIRPFIKEGDIIRSDFNGNHFWVYVNDGKIGIRKDWIKII